MPLRRLPTLVVSSVIRGSQHGQSHGGVYLVNMDIGTARQKLDWNRTDIDVSGRGGDRGLRGIGFHAERVLIAANAELLVLDQDFRVLESHTNPYLRHCHEISVMENFVVLTATGFDSLLTFDLKRKRFVDGWHLSGHGNSLNFRRFDPASGIGPVASHHFHLNSVTVAANCVWFAGLNTPGLLKTDGKTLSVVAPLPAGTHNAQLLDGGLLYNDTAANRVCYRRQGRALELPVPAVDTRQIVNLQRFGSNVARVRFARGLCAVNPGLIAGGSSPSTVALYDLIGGQRIAEHCLSMDVRNAVHGLAVWPFS